jgi:hypothetical protein
VEFVQFPAQLSSAATDTLPSQDSPRIAPQPPLRASGFAFIQLYRPRNFRNLFAAAHRIKQLFGC